MHSMLCHLALHSMLCHLALHSMLCHLALNSMLCHLAFKFLHVPATCVPFTCIMYTRTPCTSWCTEADLASTDPNSVADIGFYEGGFKSTGLAVTVGHRTNSGQSCNVSGQICYLSGQPVRTSHASRITSSFKAFISHLTTCHF